MSQPDLCPHCGFCLIRDGVNYWRCNECKTDFTASALEYYAANPSDRARRGETWGRLSALLCLLDDATTPDYVRREALDQARYLSRHLGFPVRDH